MVEHVPFYYNWEFWTVCVSILALVLSQLPPVYLLIKGAKLEIEIYSRIVLLHKVGNPNIQLHLVINNVGGRSVKVKNVNLLIKRDGKDLVLMPAQNYYQNANDKGTVLFTPFLLEPNAEWSHIVNFLNYFSREDNKVFKNAESAIRVDIKTKLKSVKNKKPEELVEADQLNVKPFLEMFDKNFIWKPGEYEAILSIDSLPDTKQVWEYRFTIFESDSNEFIKSKDDFKYADGINWDSGKYPGVVIQVIPA